MHLRERSAGVLIFAALVAALALAIPSIAAAAPTEPTLGLVGLQAKLESAPASSVPGYFKTVVKGSTIVTIPVTVEAISGDPSAPDDALIMFEASGPLIDHFGGIVAGMSGSPIYVSDGGVDKLIGAVSYGDYFTLNGTGLATPIEAMSELEQYPPVPAAQTPLVRPIITAGTVVKRVIVASDPQDYRAEAAQGAFVAKSLNSVLVGGIAPGTRMYKALAATMASRGVDIEPLGINPGSVASFGGVPFSTDLTAGAAIAEMSAYGDMWVGGIGTVTYANPSNVLAFGHPAYYTGPSHLFMTNAWIDGIWNSSYDPFKVGRPGALRGTITQDRGAGVLGKLDEYTSELTVTAEATDIDTGKVSTSTVIMPRQFMNSPDGNPEYLAAAAYIAGSKLFDVGNPSGSAATTATIKVSDGTNLYTIVLPNVWDDQSDIAYTAVGDIENAVWSLSAALDWGEPLDIQSIDLQSSFSTAHNDADIVDVDTPHGLKTGANPVRVSFLRYGIAATQTVDCTITIPAGMPLDGTLKAQSVSYMGDFGSSGATLTPNGSIAIIISGPGGGGNTTRESVGQIVSDIYQTVPNNVLTVSYSAGNSGPGNSYADMPVGLAAIPHGAVETTLATPWALTDSAENDVNTLSAHVFPAAIPYGGQCIVAGPLDSAPAGTIVSIYGTTAGGGTEALLATTTAEDFGGGDIGYAATLGPLTANTSLRVHIDASEGLTQGEAHVTAKVQARVGMKASAKALKLGKNVTLTASVTPTSTAGGTATFQYYRNKKWTKISTKTLALSGSGSRAVVSWTPPVGTWSVRVMYGGGVRNIGTASSATTIKVTK